MKANKHSIFLVHIFKIFSPINLPKFASITQFFLKFGHFLQFSSFFSLIWLHWALSWIFQRIRMSSYNFSRKSYIWLNIWAKGGKKWPKICRSMLYTVTNNAITSEANSIFSWNKKQWKPNKIVFLMIYTFVYFKENVFPKYALIFQTLRKFGNFCHFREVFFNFFVYCGRVDYSIGFSKN